MWEDFVSVGSDVPGMCSGGQAQRCLRSYVQVLNFLSFRVFHKGWSWSFTKSYIDLSGIFEADLEPQEKSLCFDTFLSGHARKE